jgi:hypothetical protein
MTLNRGKQYKTSDRMRRPTRQNPLPLEPDSPEHERPEEKPQPFPGRKKKHLYEINAW